MVKKSWSPATAFSSAVTVAEKVPTEAKDELERLSSIKEVDQNKETIRGLAGRGESKVIDLKEQSESKQLLNVSINKSTHRKLRMYCAEHNITSNKVVQKLLDDFLKKGA